MEALAHAQEELKEGHTNVIQTDIFIQIREHIAILDDVMTTGSTAHELAYLLKKAGVDRVDVWVCARA